MMMLFLHGLDSSGDGTKGRYFKENFPKMIVPDFEGSLELRLQKLEYLSRDCTDLILVGSSFGGLMAACFATAHPARVKKLFLMAPALNFPGFLVPKEKIAVPVYLLIGENDDVTPPSEVIPLAKQTFSNLDIHLVSDDHLLHQIFPTLNWEYLLSEER